MPTTALEYAQSVAANGADAKTTGGMMLALATAAREWSNVPEGERNLAKAKDIIRKAALDDKNSFLKEKGTAEIVAAYADSLIDRSTKKDHDQGKADGTNIIAYLNAGAQAVNDPATDKKANPTALSAKLDDMMKGDRAVLMSGYDQALAVRATFTKLAKEHLGMEQEFTLDFKKTMGSDEFKAKLTPRSERDPKKKDEEEYKMRPPQASGLGEIIMQVLMALLTMFLGGDATQAMAAFDKPAEAAQNPETRAALTQRGVAPPNPTDFAPAQGQGQAQPQQGQQGQAPALTPEQLLATVKVLLNLQGKSSATTAELIDQVIKVAGKDGIVSEAAAEAKLAEAAPTANAGQRKAIVGALIKFADSNHDGAISAADKGFTSSFPIPVDALEGQLAAVIAAAPKVEQPSVQLSSTQPIAGSTVNPSAGARTSTGPQRTQQGGIG